MHINKIAAVILAAGFMYLCGCINTREVYRMMNPNPKFTLPVTKTKKSLALNLHGSINDDERGVCERGFTNGFKKYFKLDIPKAEADLIMDLKVFRIDTIVATGGSNSGAESAYSQTSTKYGNTAYNVTYQITYEASLAGKSGEVIKQSAKSVAAKPEDGANYDPSGVNKYQSMIEAMYEEIAKDFFSAK